ncbi:MAG: 2-isopropylmalate synthase [Burkholderiales bacterium]|nr:2-isopropylmalate synthase [Burkholderiales bacterium]
MLTNPSEKYRPFAPVGLKDRTWPDRVIASPPIWMSTDLRDGNQALIEPMSVEKKLRMFETLIRIGFKEIEVAFPSASKADFDFVRMLIEEERIPQDVAMEVLTPSRENLISRTLESLRGAKRAIVHLYNATSPLFRRTVFGLDRAGTIDLALRGVRQIKAHAEAHPETQWIFQYSPETFTATELDFAKEICDAVSEAWGATMILNLPATVEMSSPNGYADQVEWMHRNLARRDALILSVHPHNDRGCAVAAAELALMAGADRVEGCLFGNGERTGNVDIVTLALNLYTQGIHPGLDFSDIDLVRQCYEYCTRLPVHLRHPYVGDLVFTAFSGSHQDAIRKGFAATNSGWDIPYLPIDPADLGRNYGAIIRVNSQSGKGGIAYLLEQEYGLAMPRRLQIEFSQVVQREMDAKGLEVSAEDLHALFEKEYLKSGTYRYCDHRIVDEGEGEVDVIADISDSGVMRQIRGCGNGPIDAFVRALGGDIHVLDYHEHSIGAGANAMAVAYLEMRVGKAGTLYGVGMDPNIVTASFKAILSGLNRSQVPRRLEATA